MHAHRFRTLAPLLGVLLAGGISLAAQARGPGSRRAAPAPAPSTGLSLKEVRDAFQKADGDRSGGLTVDEAAFGGLDAAAFTAGDADADNRLSLDEYVVASESRAKSGAGAAADLSAESTRVQALRRAQKSEEAKSKREARPALPAPGEAAPAGRRPQAGTPSGDAGAPPGGPAAARRALAPAAPAAPAASDGREPTLEERRASILRRLRRGEATPDEARAALEAIDRRIANSQGAPAAPAASDAPAAGADGKPAAAKPLDVQAIEESLARRIRNSDIDGEKAAKTYQDVQRRLENAGGAPAPAPGAPVAPVPPANGTRATDEAAVPAAQGFRAKIADAQGDLNRRLRGAGATPDQAAAERAEQAKRIRNGAESLAPAPQPPPAPARSAPPAGGDVPAARPARPERPPPDGAQPPAPARRASEPPAPAPVPPSEGARPAPKPADGAPAPAPRPADGAGAPKPAEQGAPKPARPAPKPNDGGR